jgi:hypothetical protein
MYIETPGPGAANEDRTDGNQSRRLFGLLVLIADVWAIVNVFGSSASTGAKVVWTVLILLLPVLGFIIWLIAGPRGVRT